MGDSSTPAQKCLVPWYIKKEPHVTLVAKIYIQVTLSYIAKWEGLQSGLQCIY